MKNKSKFSTRENFSEVEFTIQSFKSIVSQLQLHTSPGSDHVLAGMIKNVGSWAPNFEVPTVRKKDFIVPVLKPKSLRY
jgi:hypothetical protein